MRGVRDQGDGLLQAQGWLRGNLAANRNTSCAEGLPLLLLVTHIPIPRSSNERKQNSSSIRARDMQIKHEHSEQDGQDLFDIRCAKTLKLVSRAARR